MPDVIGVVASRLPGATVEYPGYIALGDWCFGTANGNWGADKWEGEAVVEAVESAIPGDSTNVDAIVAWIRNVIELDKRHQMEFREVREIGGHDEN